MNVPKLAFFILLVYGICFSAHEMSSAETRIIAWGGRSQVVTNFPKVTNATAISASSSHCLALLEDGKVVRVGLKNKKIWGEQKRNAKIVGICSGFWLDIAISEQGSLINLSDHIDVMEAQPLKDVFNISSVAVGAMSLLALQDNGVPLAWGETNSDLFGKTSVPNNLSNVTSIAAGSYHNLALRRDGTVVAWGAGEKGRFGQHDRGQSIVPQGVTNIIAIAAAGWHSMALSRNGRVFVWGNNESHQREIPPNVKDIVAIATGGTHCLALSSDGFLFEWGLVSANFGRPTVLPPIIAIAAGDGYSVALVRVMDEANIKSTAIPHHD